MSNEIPPLLLRFPPPTFFRVPSDRIRQDEFKGMLSAGSPRRQYPVVVVAACVPLFTEIYDAFLSAFTLERRECGNVPSK